MKLMHVVTPQAETGGGYGGTGSKALTIPPGCRLGGAVTYLLVRPTAQHQGGQCALRKLWLSKAWE